MNTYISNLLIKHRSLLNPDRYQYTSFHFKGFECGDGRCVDLANFGLILEDRKFGDLVIFAIYEKGSRLQIDAQCEENRARELDMIINRIERDSISKCEKCGQQKDYEHDCTEDLLINSFLDAGLLDHLSRIKRK